MSIRRENYQYREKPKALTFLISYGARGGKNMKNIHNRRACRHHGDYLRSNNLLIQKSVNL